jgi:ribosome-associated protein
LKASAIFYEVEKVIRAGERPPIQPKRGGRLAEERESESRKRTLLCANASLEKKAKDLVILRVNELSAFTDYFILCSGSSERQVRAIASAIQENLKKEGILPLGVEGEAAGSWILLDYDDVILHVFLDRVRTFYDLERLWSEAPRMAIPDESTSLKALAEGM